MEPRCCGLPIARTPGDSESESHRLLFFFRTIVNKFARLVTTITSQPAPVIQIRIRARLQGVPLRV